MHVKRIRIVQLIEREFRICSRAVAGMVQRDKRATAYGIFNTGYGLFWFLGSFLMGALYDYSIPYLVAFSMAAQLASAPLLATVNRRSSPAS